MPTPDSYRPASWRNTLTVQDDGLGIGFDLPDRSVVRLRLDLDSARQLCETLREELPVERPVHQPQRLVDLIAIDLYPLDLPGQFGSRCTFRSESGRLVRLLVPTTYLLECRYRDLFEWVLARGHWLALARLDFSSEDPWLDWDDWISSLLFRASASRSSRSSSATSNTA